MRTNFTVRKPGLIVAATFATVMLTGASAELLAADLDSTYLPIARWSGDIGFTSNPADTNSLSFLNDISFMHGLAGILFSIGGIFWQIAIFVLGITDSIGDTNSWGQRIDYALQGVLSALVDPSTDGLSPIAVFILTALLVAVLSGLYRIRRQGAMVLLKRVLVIAILSGIFWFSSSQVLSSDSSGKASSTYKPPVGTPGWVVKTVADGIDFASGALVNPIVTGMSAPPTRGSTDESLLGCSNVLVQMSESYKDEGGAAMARAVSSMWELQALPAYIGIQFGSSNSIGPEVFCRQLDRLSDDVDAGNSYVIDMKIKRDSRLYRPGGQGVGAPIQDHLIEANGAFIGPRYAAYNTLSERQWNYTMLAWAACDYLGLSSGGNDRWAVDPMFEGVTGGSGEAEITEEACQEWSELETLEAGADGEGFPAAFIWDRSTVDRMVSEISESDPARAEEVRDFLRVLGGDLRIGNAWAYMATSGVSATIIGGVGLIALIAKALTMFFLVSVWFLLVVSLFRAKPVADVLGPSLLKLLGSTLVAYGAALILSIIVTFSVVINALLTSDLRYTMFGVWVAGVSPLLAAIAVHLFFVKSLRLPSPMSLKGMREWSKGAPFAAGALVGGVAGVGGSILGRKLDEGGKSAARSAGSAVKRATMNKLGLGEKQGPVGRSGRGFDGGSRSAKQMALVNGGGKPGEGTLQESVSATKASKRQQLRAEQQRLRDAGHLKDATYFRQQRRQGRAGVQAAKRDLAEHKRHLQWLQTSPTAKKQMSAPELRRRIAQEKLALNRAQAAYKTSRSEHRSNMRQVRIDTGRTRFWNIRENYEAAKQQTAKSLGDKPAGFTSTVATAARTVRNSTMGATTEERQRRRDIARRTTAAGLMVGSLGMSAPLSAALMAPDITRAARNQPGRAQRAMEKALEAEAAAAEQANNNAEVAEVAAQERAEDAQQVQDSGGTKDKEGMGA